MLGIRPRFWLLAAVATAASAFLLFSSGPSRDVPEESVAMQPARPAAERNADAATPALEPGAATVDVSSLTAEKVALIGALLTMNESAEAARRKAAARRRPPRDETPEDLEFEKRARDEAEWRGVELPPELREEIDGLEPLPDESEQEFAERRENLENEAMTDELLVDVIIWRQHVNHIYRWGEPLSQYEAMARRRVARMPLTRQVAIFRSLRRMDRNNLGEPIPRFYPPDAVAPYDRPDAEAPPPIYIWAEPDS